MSNQLFENSDCETEDSGDDVTIATGISTPRRPGWIPVVQREKASLANEVVAAQIKRVLDIPDTRGQFHQFVDIYLLGREWTALCTHTNHTASTLTHRLSYETSLKTTSGSDTTIEWDIAATFSDLSIDIKGSQRCFADREVGAGVTHSVEVPVQPGRTTIFFQRCYHFKTVTWFTVGDWGISLFGREVAQKIRLETMQTIHSNETMGCEDRLSGVGELPIRQQDLVQAPPDRWISYYPPSGVYEYFESRGVKVIDKE
ncbi:hypothetical protein L873DRAFT_1848728 [Choiromyces venosus 120613-1]|uniref:Uncharacterized protein n=1 Tax=Choiromyces venosus 120613-1 TaxID=1336337 RepID=A0A3N4J295_9PEZI|nr:hypothetical protein L873DRAFT_1848728 [Choiromyces venosus 120613-1]